VPAGRQTFRRWLVQGLHSWLCRRPVTRKPSWRKGKRATAVRVWRPIAKKSTANQRHAISYWWLIVTVSALLTVCEIFSCVEVENRHFRPLCSDCTPPSGGTLGNNNLCIAEVKSTFSGLQFCRWQYRSIFIRLAVVASQICEMTRNSEIIRTYSSSKLQTSRSSKVIIDLGANRKRTCNNSY